MSSKFTLRNLLCLILLISSINLSFATTNETFTTGSKIINMGVVPQTVGNALKPYGLVYALIKNNNVPVKWVINPSKTWQGVDFTHNGVTYKSGAFIIPKEYLTTAVNATISTWTA